MKMVRIKNLIVELNNNCNSNCIYCYMEDRKKTGEGALESLKNKIEKFRKEGIENIDFTGGEPLLSKHVSDLVIFAKRIGYKNISLVTNGRLLSYGPYCRKMISEGVSRVIVSYDGPNEEISDSITRSPGSFSQVNKAIKNIKKCNIELGATIVLNKLNYMYVKEMVSQLYGLGVDFVSMQFILPHAKYSRRLPSWVIPKYKEVLPFISETLDEFNDKLKINVHFIPYCELRGYENNLKEESTKFDRYIINFEGNDYNMGEHLKEAATKIAKCEKCEYNNDCIGFFFSYAKELGIDDKEAE